MLPPVRTKLEEALVKYPFKMLGEEGAQVPVLQVPFRRSSPDMAGLLAAHLYETLREAKVVQGDEPVMKNAIQIASERGAIHLGDNARIIPSSAAFQVLELSFPGEQEPLVRRHIAELLAKDDALMREPSRLQAKVIPAFRNAIDAVGLQTEGLAPIGNDFVYFKAPRSRNAGLHCSAIAGVLEDNTAPFNTQPLILLENGDRHCYFPMKGKPEEHVLSRLQHLVDYVATQMGKLPLAGVSQARH